MTTIVQRSTKRIVDARLSETIELLRLRGDLVGESVTELRDRFLSAVDAGATDVVVDLGASRLIEQAAVDLLAAMSDLMRGRGGMLWLAATSPDRRGSALMPVDGPGLEALAGVCAPLDAALSRSAA